MNGIEKIIAHIDTEAASECRTVLAEAGAKCAEIQAYYEKAASDEYNKIISRGAQDAETFINRLGHVDVLESKKQVLAVKQELVSLAFEQAARQLVELPDKDYIAFLVRLATTASRSGFEQIVLSRTDRDRYGNTVRDQANNNLAAQGKPAQLTLSEEARDMRGGLILVSGDIEVNCSIDTLIAQNKKNLSSEVAEILFD